MSDALNTDVRATTTQAPLNPKMQTLQRRLQRQKEEEMNLTFKPNLVSKSSNESTISAIGGMSRFDRLYKDAQKRQEDGINRAQMAANSVGDSSRSRASSVNSRSSSASRGSRMSAESVNRLYNSSGAGRQLNKEKTAAELAAVTAMQNTFKPEITKRASSITRPRHDTGDRMIKQFQDQIERKKKLEQDIAKQTAKECTFSPVLNKSRPSSASRVRGGAPEAGSGGDDKLAAPFKQRLQLYEQERQRRREQLIKAKEDAEAASMRRISTSAIPADLEAKVSEKIKSMGTTVFDRLAARVEKDPSSQIDPKLEAELTFKPQLNSKALNAHTRSADAANVPIHERLFNEAAAKRAELEQERLAALEKEAQALSFKPKIPLREDGAVTENHNESTSSSTHSQPHVFERLSSSRQYMHNLLTQIKSDLEMSECTFKPKIPAESEAVMYRNSNKPIHERLNEEALSIKEKEVKREAERLKKEIENATFKPHIPETSEQLAANYVAAKSVPIHDRLNAEAKELKKRRESQIQELESKSYNNFTPLIPETSAQMVITHKNDKSIHERLNEEAIKEKQRLKKLEDAKIQNDLKGATFAPTINATSERIAQRRKSLMKSKTGSSSSSSSSSSSNNNNSSSSSSTSSSHSNGSTVSSNGDIHDPEVAKDDENQTSPSQQSSSSINVEQTISTNEAVVTNEVVANESVSEPPAATAPSAANTISVSTATGTSNATENAPSSPTKLPTPKSLRGGGKKKSTLEQTIPTSPVDSTIVENMDLVQSAATTEPDVSAPATD